MCKNREPKADSNIFNFIFVGMDVCSQELSTDSRDGTGIQFLR